MPVPVKPARNSKRSPDHVRPLNPERAILIALGTSEAIAIKHCQTEGLRQDIWRDVSRLARGDAGSQLPWAKLPIDQVSEKSQRALKARVASQLVSSIRHKARSNRRISASDLDDALYGMIVTMNNLATMGEDRGGYFGLVARGDLAKDSSSRGGGHTPSARWKIPAREIFETLRANGEPDKAPGAWVSQICKEAERHQKGSTSSWPSSETLSRAVSGWLKKESELPPD